MGNFSFKRHIQSALTRNFSTVTLRYVSVTLPVGPEAQVSKINSFKLFLIFEFEHTVAEGAVPGTANRNPLSVQASCKAINVVAYLAHCSRCKIDPESISLLGLNKRQFPLCGKHNSSAVGV